jgi:septin family protein
VSLASCRYGFVDVDNPEHCEFSMLKQMLVQTSLLDLVETTNRVHYEIYREHHCTVAP